MIQQLNPPIDVLTPLGRGLALLVIDYGVHLNSIWVVASYSDGQLKHFDSNDVRLAKNWTLSIPDDAIERLENVKATPGWLGKALEKIDE